MTPKQARHEDWARRLGLTPQEIRELERRARRSERTFTAELRFAVKTYLQGAAA